MLPKLYGVMTALLGVFSGSGWEHMLGGGIQVWGAKEGFTEEIICTLSSETPAGVSPEPVEGERLNVA